MKKDSNKLTQKQEYLHHPFLTSAKLGAMIGLLGALLFFLALIGRNYLLFSFQPNVQNIVFAVWGVGICLLVVVFLMISFGNSFKITLSKTYFSSLLTIKMHALYNKNSPNRFLKILTFGFFFVLVSSFVISSFLTLIVGGKFIVWFYNCICVLSFMFLFSAISATQECNFRMAYSLLMLIVALWFFSVVFIILKIFGVNIVA